MASIALSAGDQIQSFISPTWDAFEVVARVSRGRPDRHSRSAVDADFVDYVLRSEVRKFEAVAKDRRRQQGDEELAGES